MLNYGVHEGGCRENKEALYKNGLYIVSVIKHRASKKLGVEAFNTVQLFDNDMKSITN